MACSLPFRLAVLAVAAPLLAACGKTAEPTVAPRIVAVEAPMPLSGINGEAYPGSVHARVETRLSFRVAGKITERKVDVGAHVTKGTVLALLDPQDARLNVEASSASVAAAEADAKLADADFKRYQDLLSQGFISKSLLDSYQNQRDLAQARLEQARSQHAVVRNQANYTTLVADADGTVTELLADAGQVVDAGTPVFGFARDGEREAVIAVPEGQVETLTKAAGLAITLWAVPGKTYEGRVREISASADPGTRTHTARISFVAPDESVKLGMTANVIAGNAAPTQAFRLPPSALAEVNKQPSVWIVKAGEPATAQPLPVQVLQYLNDAVVVSGALQPGDRLISAGVHLLKPGMPVQPIERKAPVAL